MIEKLIAYSIRNPVLIVALALLVTAWGIYAMFHTPVAPWKTTRPPGVIDRRAQSKRST